MDNTSNDEVIIESTPRMLPGTEYLAILHEDPELVNGFVMDGLAGAQDLVDEVANSPFFFSELMNTGAAVNRKRFYAQMVLATLMVSMSGSNFDKLRTINRNALYCAPLGFVFDREYARCGERNLNANIMFRVLMRIAQDVTNVSRDECVRGRFMALLNEVSMPYNEHVGMIRGLEAALSAKDDSGALRH